MGLHNESANAKCPALEAEMRRRLWWSLISFDTRICELADFKTAMLAPTWDCRTPLNLNDFDLQPEMKDLPAVQDKSSEALFVVVRSEMGDFVRHCAFHLDFINPALKAIAKDVQGGQVLEGGELVALEKLIEDNYLKYCNPENSLHYMTIWTARCYLAKNQLLEHYSRFPKSSVQHTDLQRDAAISHALSILDCDTNLMSSPLTKRFLWFIYFHFPFPAYIHVAQDLKLRPVSNHAERAWRIMSDNFEARLTFPGQDDSPIFKVFTKMILQAWRMREEVFRQSGKPLVPPQIVSRFKQKLAQTTQDVHDACTKQSNDIFGMNSDLMSMPVDSEYHNLLYGMGEQGYVGSEPGLYHDIPGQAALDVDLNDLNSASMDWSSLYRCD